MQGTEGLISAHSGCNCNRHPSDCFPCCRYRFCETPQILSQCCRRGVRGGRRNGELGRRRRVGRRSDVFGASNGRPAWCPPPPLPDDPRHRPLASLAGSEPLLVRHRVTAVGPSPVPPAAASLVPWPRSSPAPSPPVRRRASRRPSEARCSSAWPLIVVFPLLPLWWVLGVSGLILSICCLPLLGALVLRRRLLVPRGFGLYLLFLGWCVISATQVAESRQAFSAGYRGTMYLGAGLLFLYVLNAPRDELSPDRAVRIMASFFVITVIGGMIGWSSPTSVSRRSRAAWYRRGCSTDSFVKDLVSASTSSGRAFAAYPIFRPKAPVHLRERMGRRLRDVAAVCAVRDRDGANEARPAGAAAPRPSPRCSRSSSRSTAAHGCRRWRASSTRRSAWRAGRNAQLLRVVAVVAMVLGVLLFVTPLGDIIMTRLQNGYGDAHRAQLYSESA